MVELTTENLYSWTLSPQDSEVIYRNMVGERDREGKMARSGS